MAAGPDLPETTLSHRYRVVSMISKLCLPLFASALVPGILTLTPNLLAGQDRARTETDTVRFEVDAITVTATRSERPVFLTPVAAAAIGRDQVSRLQVVSAAEALMAVPGIDISGVGGRQARPVVRGLRGQRILLLADGLRLNNARRQQDFGELPALTPPSRLQRVEVVKGPGSVLYGTDALGGVINLITRRPAAGTLEGWGGLRFGTAQDDWSGHAGLAGGNGTWDFDASGHWRTAQSYTAPSGDFGSIRLQDPVEVRGSGSSEQGGRLGVGYTFRPGHRISFGGELSDADESAFGYVDPSAYAEDQPVIDIRYPSQRFSRITGGYEAGDLEAGLLDHLDLRVYRQDNERELRFGLSQSFGPQAPPGAGLELVTENFTDVETLGFRLEAKKLASSRVLVTYGVDGFRDRSDNTDRMTSTVSGFGPPQVETDDSPQLPNASYTSYGAFAQTEVDLGDLTVTLGARGQRVDARTRETTGLDLPASDRTEWSVVGSLNALYRLSEQLVAVGSIGRGFRAPNLVELFFEGPVAEAGAYQIRSPDLDAETSLSVDLGVRYRSDRVAVEAFVFNNDLAGGVRAGPTGDTISGFPVFQNVNLEELRYRGAEAGAQVMITPLISVGGTFSWVSSEDRLDPDNPIGDTFDKRSTMNVELHDSEGSLWGRLDVRRNGERKEVDLGTNPLGPVLPAFTVVDLSAGIGLNRWGSVDERLVVRLENVTDALYAEFPNAAFFRPAPGRRLVAGVELSF